MYMNLKFALIPAASALLLSACTLPFIGKTTENLAQTTEQKAAEQEILNNCKYDQEICRYLVAQMRALDSGLTMTSVTTGTNPSQSVTLMDGQGNMSSTSTLNGKETSAMIIFNNATYIKDYDDNTWMKMNSENSEDPKSENNNIFDLPKSLEDLQEEFDADTITTTYVKLGQEACGDMAPGLTCDIYEMSNSRGAASTSKVWIDTKDHLLRKMEFAMTDGGVNTIIYTYEPVSISEPAPVKEFKLPSYDMGQGEMPSQEDIKEMMENLPNEAPNM
jgi:outer membrane lipoprotein-sorting protein